MYQLTYYGPDGHPRTRWLSYTRAIDQAGLIHAKHPKAAPIYVADEEGNVVLDLH